MRKLSLFSTTFVFFLVVALTGTGMAGIGPCIDIEKHTNSEDADAPPGPIVYLPETITWEYFIHNCGDVPLFDIEVIDSHLGPFCLIPLLGPGQGDI